jgi:uncharacterized damage-inducible protein DinB
MPAKGGAMTVLDVLELYRYDRWANGRLLDAVSGLSEGELKKPLGASFGSTLGTLRHILWSEWVWLGRWQPAGVGIPNPLSTRDLADLKASWSTFEGAQEAFLVTLQEPHLARVISYENPPGTTWSYSLQHMLQHVVNHSTYHRGQVVTLMRQLGKKPPATDFLVFFDEMEG